LQFVAEPGVKAMLEQPAMERVVPILTVEDITLLYSC
jgi:hypothetical protein